MKHFFWLIVFLWVANLATAQIPQTISWQGILQDSEGELLDGNYDLTVKIYDVATGGTALWSETHNGLSITDGLVNLMLGSINDLNVSFDSQYWLEITIGEGTPLSRTMLTSVPYAMYAKNAPTTLEGTPLILKDSLGNVRMKFDPDAGSFEMLDNDTVWYSVVVNSPPVTTTIIDNNNFKVHEENGNKEMYYTKDANGDYYKNKEVSGPMSTDNEYQEYLFKEIHFDAEGNEVKVIERIHDEYGGLQRENTYKNGKLVKEWNGFTFTDNSSSEEIESVKTNFYSEDGSDQTASHTTENISKTENTGENGTSTLQQENQYQGDILHSESIKSFDPTTGRTINEESKYNPTTGNIESRNIRESWEDRSPDGLTTTSNLKETEIKYDAEGVEIMRVERLVEDMIDVSVKTFVNGELVKQEGYENLFENGVYSSSSFEENITRDEDGNEIRNDKTETLTYKSNQNNKKTTTRYTYKYLDNNLQSENKRTQSVYTPDGSKTIQEQQIEKIDWNDIVERNKIVSIPADGSPVTENVTETTYDENRVVQVRTNTKKENGEVIEKSVAKNKPGTSYATQREKTIYSTDENGKKIEKTQYNDESGLPLLETTTEIDKENMEVTTKIEDSEGNTSEVVQNAEGIKVKDGKISAQGEKMFIIDHPTDDTKYLQHASMESNEVLNTYTGNVFTDDDGYATVTLPDYFSLINSGANIRYQLTIIGNTFARAIVYSEIDDNEFIIKTDEPNIKVSWQVIAKRNDQYMLYNPFYDVIDK